MSSCASSLRCSFALRVSHDSPILYFDFLNSPVAYSIKVFGISVWSDIGKVNALSRTTNAVGAAADVSIAMALVFLLHRARSGYRRTQAIINRLITFTINTSLLTSISSILSLITISLYPHNFIYITFFLMTSRLYVTALFAT